MSNVELEVLSSNGNINLTEYLDVEQGKGMEPGDPKFTEKIFAKSLLKSGATLALEALHEKELVFPLKLRSSTKDSLTSLIRRINVIINTANAQVRWKDEGAASSTYYDLISGQLDDEYDYRMGTQDWLPCKLRLFTQPLGYNESARVGVTQQVSGTTSVFAFASGPVVQFPAASPIAGDAPALLNVVGGASVSATITWQKPFEQLQALSVLPTTSYKTAWGGVGSPLATTNAIEGQFSRLVVPSAGGQITQWHLEAGEYQYVGDQRILLIARASSAIKVNFRMYGNFNEDLRAAAATVQPAATIAGWNVYDMGVFRIPSIALTFRQSITCTPVSFKSGPATITLDVAGFVMLPDINTSWVDHSPKAIDVGENPSLRNVSLRWDGTIIQLYRPGLSEATAPAIWTAYSRGGIPQPMPAATLPPVFAMFWMINGDQLNRFGAVFGQVNIVPRTRYVF